jgi:Zn-dependent protease
LKNSNSFGFWALLFKLGPKLLPLIKALGDEILIFGKTLFGLGTGATAVASAGLYAYLFTWQTGLGLITFLIVHEYGHVWAMRKCGVKTKGMYFIPMMGAVAVMDSLVHKARHEAYISLMGPIFGLVFFALPCYIWWMNTGNEHVAAIATVATLINLINLLPIMPLDGGRMLKSISYSENAASSLIIVAGISAVTAFGAWQVGFTLFALMAFIGFIELFVLFGIREQMRNFIATVFRVGWIFLFYVFTIKSFLPVILTDISVWKMTMFSVIQIALFVILALDFVRLRADRETAWQTIFSYPGRVSESAWQGLKEVRGLRTEHIKAIENYEVMPRDAKRLYALLLVVICAIHVVIMMQLGETITGAMFGNMLK